MDTDQTATLAYTVFMPRELLQYFHIYVGSDHFWGFKILNFNIFFYFLFFFYFFFFFFLGGGGVRKFDYFGDHFYTF